MRVRTAPVLLSLVPLFLVSLAAVGYETALTRYFAVAKWSEYGYWVISIVMVGFALPDDGMHAANERFHLPTFRCGVATCIRLLAELGRTPAVRAAGRDRTAARR